MHVCPFVFTLRCVSVGGGGRCRARRRDDQTCSIQKKRWTRGMHTEIPSAYQKRCNLHHSWVTTPVHQSARTVDMSRRVHRGLAYSGDLTAIYWLSSSCGGHFLVVAFVSLPCLSL
uniref:Secreted protein n=1 Tax=Echinococcus granulosus TaxID=6210 RepID=A0A068WYA5_ECHGR|nr:hypothetical protein EgrG_000715100 [Echinococcus granulosus]